MKKTILQSIFDQHLFLANRFVFGGGGDTEKQGGEIKDEGEKKEEAQLTPEEKEAAEKTRADEAVEEFKGFAQLLELARGWVKVGEDQYESIIKITAEFDQRMKEALKDDKVTIEELAELREYVSENVSSTIWDILSKKEKKEEVSKKEEVLIMFRAFQGRLNRLGRDVPRYKKMIDGINVQIGELFNDAEITKEELLKLLKSIVEALALALGPPPENLFSSEKINNVPAVIRLPRELTETFLDPSYVERVKTHKELGKIFEYTPESGESADLTSAKNDALFALRYELCSVYSAEFQSELAKAELANFIAAVEAIKGAADSGMVDSKKDDAQKALRRAKKS
jgi:hypothetical protein